MPQCKPTQRRMPRQSSPKFSRAFSLNDCAARSGGAVTVKKRYRPTSHCGRQAAADIECLGKNRAVRLLVGCNDDNLRARLEFILVARRDRRNRRRRRNDNFLFASLNFTMTAWLSFSVTLLRHRRSSSYFRALRPNLNADRRRHRAVRVGRCELKTPRCFRPAVACRQRR